MEPIIVEDLNKSHGDELIRLDVLWSRGYGIERSELIAGVCERARGRDYALSVTSAAGIEYTPLEQGG